MPSTAARTFSISAAAAEEALRAAASDRLAPYKRPKTYIEAKDLPHTATGKLIRRSVPDHLGLPDGTG